MRAETGPDRVAASLDCNALRQVSRLIYIAASKHGNVIGQQLERNRQENRDKVIRQFGDRDKMGGPLRDMGIAFGSNGNHDAFSRADLFDVAQHFS